jgi:hypothetical protein
VSFFYARTVSKSLAFLVSTRRISNQQPIESCRTPWSKTAGMHNDKGDVTANTYARRERVYSRIIVTIGHTSQGGGG